MNQITAIKNYAYTSGTQVWNNALVENQNLKNIITTWPSVERKRFLEIIRSTKPINEIPLDAVIVKRINKATDLSPKSSSLWAKISRIFKNIFGVRKRTDEVTKEIRHYSLSIDIQELKMLIPSATPKRTSKIKNEIAYELNKHFENKAYNKDIHIAFSRDYQLLEVATDASIQQLEKSLEKKMEVYLTFPAKQVKIKEAFARLATLHMAKPQLSTMLGKNSFTLANVVDYYNDTASITLDQLKTLYQVVYSYAWRQSLNVKATV